MDGVKKNKTFVLKFFFIIVLLVAVICLFRFFFYETPIVGGLDVLERVYIRYRVQGDDNMRTIDIDEQDYEAIYNAVSEARVLGVNRDIGDDCGPDSRWILYFDYSDGSEEVYYLWSENNAVKYIFDYEGYAKARVSICSKELFNMIDNYIEQDEQVNAVLDENTEDETDFDEGAAFDEFPDAEANTSRDDMDALNISLIATEDEIIPFCILYADVDLEEATGWDEIERFDRCVHEGKVYEFIVSDKLSDSDDYCVESILLITDVNDRDNYQLIEISKPSQQIIHTDTFYFEDVTYDGNEELLIDYGGFGTQGCYYMGCFRYDKDACRYVEIPGFSDIPNPELDSQQEYVFGSIRENAATHCEEVYQYINGEYARVYTLRSEYSYDSEQLIWSVDGEEIGRTDGYDDLEGIDNPVFDMFWKDNSLNSRVVGIINY